RAGRPPPRLDQRRQGVTGGGQEGVPLPLVVPAAAQPAQPRRPGQVTPRRSQGRYRYGPQPEEHFASEGGVLPKQGGGLIADEERALDVERADTFRQAGRRTRLLLQGAS